MRTTIIILTVVLIAVVCAGSFYYFQEEDAEEPEEEVVFNEEFVKNSNIKVYCDILLNSGSFSTENLSLYCEDETLPEKSFELSVLDTIVYEDYAFLLTLSAVEGAPKRFDLLAVDKEKQFASRVLEEEPRSLQQSGDFLEISFDSQKKKYRLIRDRFEEVVEESDLYGSTEYGFFVSIPQNWEAEKRGDSFFFYHPDSVYTHSITLKVEESKGEAFSLEKNGYFYNIYTDTNTPYTDVYQQIIDSLTVNSLHTFSDYRFLEEGLETYLKVDTREGSLIYYEDGEQVAQFEILNMIDRENWGGTPSGLYEVLSKEGLRFSTTSEVYMPFSIRFYGKYLIHGEPYYPSGAPYTAPVSGGCIRVKNEKMEQLYDLLEKETPILIIPEKNDDFPVKENSITRFPQVSADSYLVADIDSGKVFADKDAEKVRPVASITKVLTGLVIAEHFNTEHAIRVQEYMLTGRGETEGIYTGRVFRLIDLLPPLLIESSNNAAKVLASYFGEEDTVERMNEKAKMIGMMNTNFVESSGIEKENVSTAKDIYYLAYYLANSRVPFLNISKKAWTPTVNYAVFPKLKNQNIFYNDPQFMGGKSGFTDASKYTGFYLFNLNIGEEERRVVFVTLGSETKSAMENDVLRLKEWIEHSFD